MYVQCRVAMCICARHKRQKRAHNAVSQKILSESVAVTKEVLCGNNILNGVEMKIYINRFDHVSFEETHFDGIINQSD